ncbi:RNA polymerase sigma-70 factor, ECF subfamily [Lentzea xinjiangensis]|uniref:RNA polymerase sigma-70 factor, ECF subfamily n=1 Tax=Lentzea xinjiangensis TaxID=402600 RepID=A0A1H9NZG6_9PSEU|nr:anti-sigma factor [Lentzea xinjiangensis]SER41424.1 RNA polymerase sigma-70 factor, ECF subfamily [Lentzea xinjiangensis]
MLMEELPPEAMLDGPPPDADHLLQRTLGTVREERHQAVLRRGRITAITSTFMVAGVLAGGVWLGHGPLVGGTDDEGEVLQGTSSAGANMAVKVTETEGGLRLVATVHGVPDGAACWLVVHTKDGRSFTAGSWRAHAGEVTLAGSAMVRAGDVAGVSVVDHDRRPLVTAG